MAAPGTPWDAALWLAAALALAALAVQARQAWLRRSPAAGAAPAATAEATPTAPASSRAPTRDAWATRLLGAAAALAAAAFLRLLWAFVSADVSLQYVFLYTHTDLPLRWRVAGTWAGREGSLLLWSADLAAVGALLAWRHARTPPADGAEATGRLWTRLVLTAAVAAFLAAAAAQDTFAATPDFFLQGRPDGNGLNPTLKSPFILIHPPLMFVAYALATVPAAAVLGHLASGSDRWGRIGLPWSRADWLLYTFAMGLGGLWAYYTLGFGGYWAWDPVEVANLLPWLALTAFLHAQLHRARHGGYRILGPFLGLLPFLLTLFSTISTRSGLWVSVHAFTDPTSTFEPDAPARFLDILAVEPGLLVYVRLFLATLGAGLALWCIRLARDLGALRRAAPWLAAPLAAFGVLGALAPAAALELLFEAAWRLSGGRTGLGLLALAFAACVLAALPALVARDEAPARARRLDLRGLAAFAVAVLGLSVLVLFLAHMAAVNGWDTGYYEDRLPWLATPALLGLVVLQAHSIVGRRRSLALAAGLLAAAIAAALLVPRHREGAYLLVLSAGLVAVSLDRVRRAALAPGMGKRERLGPTLLFAAALLDLWFWLSPPASLGVGLPWRPVWPVQAAGAALATVALWGSLRLLAGAPPRRPWRVHVLAAALVGFWLAPLLAVAAWLAARRAPGPGRALDASAWARLRQVALYGAHLAVAVALLAYAPSTYWKETAQGDLAAGEAMAAGPARLEAAALRAEGEGPFADRLVATLGADGPALGLGGGGRRLDAHLQWEPTVGAYFPEPATLRTWAGDVYVNVQAVHLADGPCGEARTLRAYEAASPPQACAGDRVEGVALEATWLPGVGLIWTALALFVLAMALLLLADRPRGAPHAAAREPA